jgi:hypothetical protein
VPSMLNGFGRKDCVAQPDSKTRDNAAAMPRIRTI